MEIEYAASVGGFRRGDRVEVDADDPVSAGHVAGEYAHVVGGAASTVTLTGSGAPADVAQDATDTDAEGEEGGEPPKGRRRRT